MSDHDISHSRPELSEGAALPDGAYLFEGAITLHDSLVPIDMAPVIISANMAQFFASIVIPLDACSGMFYRMDVLPNAEMCDEIVVALIEYAARYPENKKAQATLEIFRSYTEVWAEGNKLPSEYEEEASAPADKEGAWLN